MTKRYWNGLILAIVILGVAWIQISRVPDDDEVAAQVAARVNFQSPDFALMSLDSKPVALSDYRGKIVLINFWATWCAPCRAEMQDIQATAQTNLENFVVLAINNSEDDAIVRRYVESNGLTFTILLDRDGTVARKFNVLGLPTSFFIDCTGMVRVANMGPMNRAYIEAQIAALGAK